MKKVIQISFVAAILVWAGMGFTHIHSLSQIEGTWVGQVDQFNCVFPSMIKFVSMENIITGIERDVATWSSETCTPTEYRELVLGEGFLKADSETIIFPREGGFTEFQLSDDGQTLIGKLYVSGKLLYKYELFRQK